MALPELELPEWDERNKRDRLLGCSMTGYSDATSGLSEPEKERLIEYMHKCVSDAAIKYSHDLRIPIPLLSTALKPEGSLSLVAGGVSYTPQRLMWEHLRLWLVFSYFSFPFSS